MAKRFRLEYNDYSSNVMTNGVSFFDTVREAREAGDDHVHYKIIDTKYNVDVEIGGKTPDAEQVNPESTPEKDEK